MALYKDDPVWKEYRNRVSEESPEGMPPFLLSGAHSTGINRDSYIRNNYPFAVIELVTHGCGYVTVNSVSFKAKTGDLYYLPSGSDSKVEPDKDSPWDKKYIRSIGTLPEMLMREFHLNGRYHFPGVQAEVESLFDQAIVARKNFWPNMHEAASLLWMQLAWRLRDAGEKNRIFSSAVTRIIRCIDDELFDKVDLNLIARQLNISRSHLQSLFRREVGISPYEYHLENKINKAKELLLEPNSTVEKTAARLGFYDSFHFSRIFKSKVGLSPASYRKSVLLSKNT